MVAQKHRHRVVAVVGRGDVQNAVPVVVAQNGRDRVATHRSARGRRERSIAVAEEEIDTMHNLAAG